MTALAITPLVSFCFIHSAGFREGDMSTKVQSNEWNQFREVK